MEISKIFKSSLSFPISNYQKLLILGIICILASITTIYSSLAGANGIVSPILSIVSFVFALILAGYLVSVIKNTIDGSDEIPDFEWKENFIMGIKYIILEIVYMIIPLIIILIIAYATGLFNAISQIFANVDFNLLSATTNQTAAMQAFSAVPESALNTFATSLTITVIVAIILIILFEILCIVGICRLADTGKIGKGLNVKEIFEDISDIGVGSFIIWLIIYAIIILILGIISGFIGMIPYVGGIIASLIVSSFMTLFMGRAMGLMYASKDE